MEYNTEDLQKQLTTKEQDLKDFASKAQTDLNNQQNVIQELQTKLQASVKAYQQEIDRREGAVIQLRELVTPATQEVTPETTIE